MGSCTMSELSPLIIQGPCHAMQPAFKERAIKNLEYLNLYCMPLSWACYHQMAEGETMLEVR